jgi:hypothetical protein
VNGIYRFRISATRITVRFPNGDLTHSPVRHVQIPEEYQGVYLVPDVDSYHSDYAPLLEQLRTWVAAGYRQE